VPRPVYVAPPVVVAPYRPYYGYRHYAKPYPVGYRGYY
jgi:hypothetical protein